jgi:hypothetical protein
VFSLEVDLPVVYRISTVRRNCTRIRSIACVRICEMTKGDIITDRILSFGKQVLYTESIQIVQPIKHRQRKQPSIEENKHRIIHVVTKTIPDVIYPAENGPISHIRISIQPLLILDINGVLCHRVRRRPNQDPLIMSRYRSPLGPNISQTPIIPRPDLLHFLEYLDQHFCLAIWTSAKAKTAKKLVDLLIPKLIKDRLLFVWSQGHCLVDESPSTPKSKETSCVKDLELVWQKFPLWNRYNTILIDDTPEKCTRWKENALHPPPLHGRKQRRPDTHEDSTTKWMSDEVNVSRQFAFMTLLAEHWSSCPLTQIWDSKGLDGTPSVISNECDGMATFLTKHATEFMGWKT